jgi:chromosome segregation protein
VKLSKLDIVGFKSFLDKASIQFPSGISAIVGPNGCGKSNVIDALRWVMGEQSVKQLRGKNMEDIIFSGANGKPPLNMAEVTLTMANDNGHAPEEFRDCAEIAVTRRLYRSGESAYLINKQPCRLKDVFNLFMGSGVGSRTYAIIQQGNIGAIIDAGPDERRLFLEEAAGVTRYKFRKNEALRKVKSTEQNLLRLNDIIAEVNRQMAGLQRQAKKAERYKQYQERIKQMDTRLLIGYFDDYTGRIQETENLILKLKDAELAHVTQIKTIDAAIEEIKLKRTRKNQEISDQKSHRFETQRSIDRIEAERAHLKSESERLSVEVDALEQAQKDLTTKTATIGTEVGQVETENQNLQKQILQFKDAVEQERNDAREIQEQLARLNQNAEANKNSLMQLVAEEARYKNIYQTASNSKDNLQRRLKRIDEEVSLAAQKKTKTESEHIQALQELEAIRVSLAAYERQIEALKKDLTAHSAELGAQVKQTQTLELERNKTRSQLSALKKMAANFDWYRDGVKAIMHARRTADPSGADAGHPRLDGIVGLMADLVEPAPGFENAVEAVLGEALQYVLVQDHQAGAAAVGYLQTSGAGRCGFIPISSTKPLCGAGGQLTGGQRLLDHVAVPPEFRSIAEALLGHVVVVPTLQDACELFNRNGRVQTIVTPEGDVVSHQGILLGGSPEQLSGILAKKQELKDLARKAEEMDRQAHAAVQRQEQMEEIVRRLETELQQAIAGKNSTSEEAMDAEKLHYRLGEDLKNAKRHLEIIQLEQEQLMGEESDLDEEMGKYNQALARITAEIANIHERSADTTRQIECIASQLESHNQKVVDLKLQLTSVQGKLEHGLQTLHRLKEFERDSHLRLKQLDSEIEQKRNKYVAAIEKSAAHEGGLQQMYQELKRIEERMAADETEYMSIDAALQKNDESLTAIQSEREKTNEKMRVLELDLSEKRIRRDTIAGKVQERYHISMVALRTQLTAEKELNMTAAEMEQELERLRSQMASIGEVNLGAIKEYQELKERFDFLSAQRDDLNKAVEDLHKVIRKINRITQELFMETYTKVNEKLTEVFPKLFEGGSARLELTDPNNPLETGVEYMVHPPGKKLTRMSLLSGGEKALSAIAFIFAIFLIRPTSFCLLDEIDAPLDEANVVRFNNLMRVIGEKSQIIMITHNKKSMEFAEMLFGVTMEQKGISKIVSVNLHHGKAA